MTNGEKYKTAQERAEAFWKWNGKNIRDNFTAGQLVSDAFAWLDLEADAERIWKLQKENAELRECLKEALSGIDEFMTRTIYFEHGKDIERWRAALKKASGEEVK